MWSRSLSKKHDASWSSFAPMLWPTKMYVISKSPYRGILLGGFDLFFYCIVEVTVGYEAFYLFNFFVFETEAIL